MHLASTELHVYHSDDVHVRDVSINICIRLIEKDRPDLAMSQKDPEGLLSKSLLARYTKKFPRYQRDHQYGVAHLMASNALSKLIRGVQERNTIKAEERNRMVTLGMPQALTNLASPNAALFAEDALHRMASTSTSLSTQHRSGESPGPGAGSGAGHGAGPVDF
jgi:hypothetical protein